MPGRLGRLWRTGARRAQVGEQSIDVPGRTGQDAETSAERAVQPEDVSRRLEEARQRLRRAIPPPEQGQEHTAPAPEDAT